MIVVERSHGLKRTYIQGSFSLQLVRNCDAVDPGSRRVLARR